MKSLSCLSEMLRTSTRCRLRLRLRRLLRRPLIGEDEVMAEDLVLQTVEKLAMACAAFGLSYPPLVFLPPSFISVGLKLFADPKLLADSIILAIVLATCMSWTRYGLCRGVRVDGSDVAVNGLDECAKGGANVVVPLCCQGPVLCPRHHYEWVP